MVYNLINGIYHYTCLSEKRYPLKKSDLSFFNVPQIPEFFVVVFMGIRSSNCISGKLLFFICLLFVVLFVNGFSIALVNYSFNTKFIFNSI